MRTFNSRILAAIPMILLLILFCSCGGEAGRSSGASTSGEASVADSSSTQLPSGALTIVFPKIGSADCALIMTENATVLIDTGEASTSDDILKLLDDYGRSTIDVLIITHYDQDHVGGAADIISSCKVKRVIGSTSPKDSDEYSAYLDALSSAGLSEEIPSGTLTVSLGDMNYTIWPPERKTYSAEQSNNSSLVVSLSYGNTRFLFTGDAMDERTSEFVSNLQSGSYDLIKIPHHGRDVSTVSKLLPAMKQGAAAIITSSKKEQESDDVLSALDDGGLNTYRTRDGDVTVISDGSKLTITQDN